MTSNQQRKEFFGNQLSPYNGELNEVHGGLSYIDNHLTHIDTMTETEAKGFYLGRTGRKIEFFAIKEGDVVGVGASYGHAADALLFKQTVGVPEEQRIAEFVAAHDAEELYTVEHFWNWHRKLTGSCYGGGEEFMSKHGLKKDDMVTVQYFISMTENDFNGQVIKKLKPYYDTKRMEE